MSPTWVLFDLDGTLVDSAPGILSSLSLAFAEHGLPALDDETGRALLGPPFAVSLPPLVGAALTQPVIETYRQHYSSGGMFDAQVYDGIPELLAQLAGRGVGMAVATSKAERFAVPVLAKLRLDGYFATVGGDTLDGARPTKALVVGEVLRRLNQPDDVVMVGDRIHDVEGARQHGLETLGAGWGYGRPGELDGARAVYVTPAALGAALM